jgi:hypothetical protein
MLFAACLQIHVVSVELLRDTVGSVATQHTFAQCRVQPNNTLDPNFYIMAPETAKNVIFLWNHSYKDPLSVRESLVTPADHYTLLEILEPQPKVIPENTFFFPSSIMIFLLIVKIQQKMKKTKKTTVTSKKEAKNSSQEIEVNNEKKKVLEGISLTREI